MNIPRSYRAADDLEVRSEKFSKKGAVGPVAELGLNVTGLRTFAKLSDQQRSDWMQWPGHDRELMSILEIQTRAWRSALAKNKVGTAIPAQE